MVRLTAVRVLSFTDQFIFNGDWYNLKHWVTDHIPSYVAGPGTPFVIYGTVSQVVHGEFRVPCW